MGKWIPPGKGSPRVLLLELKLKPNFKFSQSTSRDSFLGNGPRRDLATGLFMTEQIFLD